MEDEEDEFGQLYTDVLPRLPSSPNPQPPLASTANLPTLVDPRTNYEKSLYETTKDQTLVSDRPSPLKIYFHNAKNNVIGTILDNKNRVEPANEEPKELEDKEMVEYRVLNGHRLDGNSSGPWVWRNSDGLSLAEPIVDVKNGDTEENLDFDMGFEEKEEEIEAGVLNVQRLVRGLGVMERLKDYGEGSLAEPADNMDSDIGIDNLDFDPIFPALLSGTYIENVLENGENEVGMSAFETENDCGIRVNSNKDSDSEDDLTIIFNDSEWVGVNENGVGMDEKVKSGKEIGVKNNKDSDSVDDRNIILNNSEWVGVQFDMGLEGKEEEIEAGVLNVRRLDAGLGVIGQLKDCDEGSLAEQADNMYIDIGIDSLDFDPIFPELLSGTCIKNVLENGENEVGMRAFEIANDCGIGVKNNEDSDSKDDLNVISNNSEWAGVNVNGLGMDEKVKGGEEIGVNNDKDSGSDDDLNIILTNSEWVGVNFDMGLEEKEEEIEAGFFNVRRLDAGLDVIGDYKDSGEGSLAEPADNIDIDIGTDNLDFDPIFSELLSGTCIENVFENGESEVGMRAFETANDCAIGGNNDIDSDSEDDPNIILNKSEWAGVNENGLGMDEKVKGGEDLFLVTDSDQFNEVVDKEWTGADLAEVVDGESEQTGEGVKRSGALGNAIGLTIGYRDHSYHFEGAKPVAVAMLGRAPTGPAGAPGWVYPSFSCVRPVVAAMAEGATLGPRSAPGHIPSFVNVSPVADHGRADWQRTGIKSANTVSKIFPAGLRGSARGNNSSERILFTRTVFDINIDNLEEKRWRHPGVDLSDFFNFGLDELKWKDYCRQMNNDWDLPSELVTATGSCDLLAENPFRRMDATKEKLVGKGMEAGYELSPIPIGEQIKVEVGIGERFPSIDAKRPRLSESDAIIEIVFQDSLDDADAHAANEGFKENVAQMDTKTYDGLPHSCNIQSTRVHKNIRGDGIRPLPLEASRQFCPCFQQCARILGTPQEERKLHSIEKTHGMEGGKMASDKICPNDTLRDESLTISVKKPRLSSQFEQPIHDIAEGDDFRISRNIEYNKAGSGSNRDEHWFRRRDDYGKERRRICQNYMVAERKGLQLYPCSDPNSVGLDKPNVRRMRGEGTHKKWVKDDEIIKRAHFDGMKCRHNRNCQGREENDVNVYLPSRKNLENHNWSNLEKFLSPEDGRIDGTLTDQDECLDYSLARRGKDEEHTRGKILHGYTSRKYSSHRKRETCDASRQTRNGQPRIRDRLDNLHSVEYQNKSWWQKGGNDRSRLKKTYEDNQSKQLRKGRIARGCNSACTDHSASATDSQGMNAKGKESEAR